MLVSKGKQNTSLLEPTSWINLLKENPINVVLAALLVGIIGYKNGVTAALVVLAAFVLLLVNGLWMVRTYAWLKGSEPFGLVGGLALAVALVGDFSGMLFGYLLPTVFTILIPLIIILTLALWDLFTGRRN